MAYSIKLKVEPDVLRNTAAEVTSLTKSLSGDFDEMQTVVSRTAHYWVGAAGDQYRKEFAVQKKETEEILNYLRKYPTDLLTMAGVYEQSENENRKASAILPSDIL